MSDAQNPRRGAFGRFLDIVERLGNLLPHPVTLFALLGLVTLVLSAIAASFGLEVPDPRANAPEGATIAARNLLDPAGLRQIATGLVSNFTGFAPLGTVLVAMLGVGVAERSGLLGAAIRALVLGAPRNLLTAAVVFSAVLSNTASEMGYVVLIPLAAIVFHSVGRHPIAGLAAAFAGVSGGYSANLLIGTVDPLLAGITTEAAALIDPGYAATTVDGVIVRAKEVQATANWFFMSISTVMITLVGTWVTTRIVEPKLGEYDPTGQDTEAVDQTGDMGPLRDEERRGLRAAGIALLVMTAIVAATSIPADGWMRDPAENKTTIQDLRPLLRSVVTLIFVGFSVLGFVYGRTAGTMRTDRDIITGMSKAMSSMGLYMVLVFFAAQMVAFFKWSELGPITAVLGADFLQSIGLTGPLVFLPFILMCCFVNLMLGSASAQWAMTAPIFVPMLMQLGYTPEVIQAAYRIGDSTTNTITPMMSYFGLILAFAHRWDKRLGIGTIVATMIPYSIAFLVGWMILFYAWVFGLGLPVGPGAPTYISG